MKKLDIIYEDKYLLVINKPAKLLMIANNKEVERTLYHEVREYVRKKNQKVFIVHRLDFDTSGVVVFAKKEDVKNVLQNNWDSVYREYLCVVCGIVKKNREVLKDYLQESSTHQVYVADRGKLAITEYEVLVRNKKNSLLKVVIKTGRKNQIRCQLAHIGHPIVGDKKYEATTNYLGRLALCATKISLVHPVSKKLMTFEIKAPDSFYTGFSL